jgi:hypothetical protein
MMSVTDIDIYRTAKLFMEQKGDAAHATSLSREEQLLDMQDTYGALNRIAAAIEWMPSLEGEEWEMVQ